MEGSDQLLTQAALFLTKVITKKATLPPEGNKTQAAHQLGNTD
jgi:hypothetical protein